MSPVHSSIPMVPGVVDVFVIRGGGADRRYLALQRAPHVRSPGSWEAVHGKVESGERPEHAAWREVLEETGLTPARLYTITTNPFYLAQGGVVQVAIVFCAVVEEPREVTVSEEHVAHAWLTADEARTRFAWPREREMVSHVEILIGADGTAGVQESVLRVR